MKYQRPSLAYRTISWIGKMLIITMEQILEKGVKDKQTVYPVEKFSWASKVQNQSAPIKAELLEVLKQEDIMLSFPDISPEQKRIVAGNQWKTFMLYAYGHAVDKNLRKAPTTSEILKGIPGMTTAFFSVLEPQTVITPHRGPYKGVLRYHLGLIVPAEQEKCGLRVGNEVYHWSEGESFIFDDTVEHEAWNHTDEIRVVLFVDFKRDFSFPFNIINNGMIALIGNSPFVKRVLNKIERSQNTRC